jgi:ATP-dependent Clp protease adaptor protein ClpS
LPVGRRWRTIARLAQQRAAETRVDPLAFYLVTAAAFGAVWWRHLRRYDARRRVRLDEGAEIALHLAVHEADSRTHRLAALHLLYGLLQDDAIAGAIRDSGGDTEAIDDRVFAALEGPQEPDDELVSAATWLDHSVDRARPIACVDLWAALVRGAPDTCELVAGGGVRAVDVLYTLVHGAAEAEPTLPPGAREAEVALVNDDITTREHVVELLRDVFELADDEATARMLEVHRAGRGVIGRYPGSDAERRVRAARERARAARFPLRVELRPLT